MCRIDKGWFHDSDYSYVLLIRMPILNPVIRRNNPAEHHLLREPEQPRFTISPKGFVVLSSEISYFISSSLHLLVVTEFNIPVQRRRDRINEKMKALQELIPRCNKV